MRITTVHDRFTVQDPHNGLIASFATFREALDCAERQADKEDTTIYDVMAHIGRPCEWTPDGIVVDYRRD